MSSSFDVVVVGNGALGHATARALLSADPSLGCSRWGGWR